MLNELPGTSHSEGSEKMWDKKRETGGIENLCLCETGVAVMGKGMGGLKDRAQRTRGA